MRLHEITNAPGLLLTDSQVEEVIDELCRRPATSGSAPPDAHVVSRRCRGIGRALPDLLPDHCPTCRPT
jgi:hypothetical protein